MKTRYNIKVKEAFNLKAGSILIAQPFWNEEMYQRTVILVLEHDSSGTTGILLNRKSNLMLTEAIPSLKIMKTLYYGGAFDTKIISYLHSNDILPDSIYLGNGLFWGGNFNLLSKMIQENKFKLNEINFFAGFVQWSGGQLEDEINSNKWWVAELNADELFTIPSEELWTETLIYNNNLYSIFGNLPDPSTN